MNSEGSAFRQEAAGRVSPPGALLVVDRDEDDEPFAAALRESLR